MRLEAPPPFLPLAFCFAGQTSCCPCNKEKYFALRCSILPLTVCWGQHPVPLTFPPKFPLVRASIIVLLVKHLVPPLSTWILFPSA